MEQRNEEDMSEEDNGRSLQIGVTSGPLRIYRAGDELFVTGFGLRIPVKSREEGLLIIAELEDQGFRICV
jgi:hypothetical protein